MQIKGRWFWRWSGWSVCLALMFSETMAEQPGRDQLRDGVAGRLRLPLGLVPNRPAPTKDAPGLLSPTRASPRLGEVIADGEEETLGPQERLLPDGSRTGSFVYVDAHGDMVRVKYVAGPAAGPRGFRLEERPVEEEPEQPEPLESQASGMAPLLLPPPKTVRRDPTPRPSDVFWQPKERADLTKAGPPLGLGYGQGPPRKRRKSRLSHG